MRVSRVGRRAGARGARDAAGVFSLTTGGPRAAEGACPASGETAPWGNAETGHRVGGAADV